MAGAVGQGLGTVYVVGYHDLNTKNLCQALTPSFIAGRPHEACSRGGHRN